MMELKNLNMIIPMACWYGENESNMKKAVNTIKKAFPNVEVHPFEGMGHGELVGQEELFIKEMEAFMRKNSILNMSEA